MLSGFSSLPFSLRTRLSDSPLSALALLPDGAGGQEVELPETLAPAVHFDAVLPGTELPIGPSRVRSAPIAEVEYEGDPQTLAFASVATLGWLLREGRVSSVDLTRMYLGRLKRFDPQLECVVTLTEELALKQARRADAELASGLDRTVRDASFSFDGGAEVGRLRGGYLEEAFQGESPTMDFDRKALDVLGGMGVELVPVSLPKDLPLNAIRVFVLDSEEGAAFDELTRSDRDSLLIRQTVNARPDRLRKAHFIPGVEYLQANRARYLLMERMREAWTGVDVVVAPTRAPDLSTVTNLTGHPAIAVPNGFRENGTPVTISFLGQIFGEEKMLAVAHAYQKSTGFHLEHPSAFW